MQADAGVFVEFFESVERKDSVFTAYINQVRGDAYCHHIEVVVHHFGGHALFFVVGLNEFEADSCAGEFFVWVFAIEAFGVEDGSGFGQGFAGEVVVTDDDFQSQRIAIVYEFV